MSRVAVSTWRRWTEGVVVAALLFAAYMTVWQPVRTGMLTHVADPFLQQVVSERSSEPVGARLSGASIQIQYGDGPNNRATLPPPAGVTFLLPALFLCLLAPRRPVWFFFLLGHVAISSLVLVGWAVALRGSGIAIHVARVIGSYGIDAYSLMIPALVWARESGIVEQLEKRGGGS
jgi:hypothetical protein